MFASPAPAGPEIVIVPLPAASVDVEIVMFVPSNREAGPYEPSTWESNVSTATGVVEVPVEMDGKGIYPVKLEPLPEAIAGYCRTQMTIQKLLTAAYAEKSRNTLLQAMLLDPFVNSIDEANSLIDEMLELQSEFLPEMK